MLHVHIPRRTTALVTLIALSLALAVAAPKVVLATGEFVPHYASPAPVVDGLTGDWDLTRDLWAGTYNAFKTSQPQTGNAYLQYTCTDTTHATVYVLVQVFESVSVIVDTPTTVNAWLALDSQGNKVINSQGTGTFSWVPATGQPTGWEGSADISAGVHGVTAHIEVLNSDLSQTSGTTSGDGFSPQLQVNFDCSGAPAASPTPSPSPSPTPAPKASPSLTTTASSSVAIGSGAISDSATLSGSASATGTITFNVYGPGDTTCTTSLVGGTTTRTAAGDGVYTSDDYTPTAPGTYLWITNYGGDDSNNATTNACNGTNESVVVTKANAAITTTASATVALGSGSISDTATLSGGYFPTGTITFNVYGPGDTTCATPLTGSPIAATASVSGSGAYTSGTYTPTAIGTYRWIARYGGDTNNNSVSGSCGDANESVSVTKATPSIATTASFANGLLSDSATLSGSYNPTGTITFNLYGLSDATCATPIFTSTVNVASASATSGTYTPTLSGTYRWTASYGGDSNNNATAGACNDAHESVNAVITRTQGFWSTHSALANAVWNGTGPAGSTAVGADATLCGTKTISATSITKGTNQLMGGFWSSISKTSTGKARLAIDQARMQLLQQYQAAVLNVHTFGSAVDLASASTAYCGTDATAIMSQVAILTAFNQSGDSSALVTNTAASSTTAQSQANIKYWDITTH